MRLPVLAACLVVFLSLCIQAAPSPSPAPSATPEPTPGPVPTPTPRASPSPTPTPPSSAPDPRVPVRERGWVGGLAPSRAPGELLALHQRTIDTAVGHALRELPMRIDTLIALRWVQTVQPRDDLAYAIETRYREFQSSLRGTSLDPFLRMANESHRVSGELCSPSLDAVWECPLLRSLYCDLQPPPPGLLPTLANISRKGKGTVFEGYAATHALLAARFIEERGCLDRAEVSRTVEDLGGIVANQTRAVWEALQPPSAPEERLQGTDLFAEQVHFLLRTGRCGWVQPWWVESLAADLEERVRHMGVATPDYRLASPHTVLQEGLAIIYWERCLASAARGA